jgi:outer membrane protein OmpA-like peptidoglycan-associated protein
MGWKCKSCGTSVEKDDELKCPECAKTKTSWTMVAKQTRTFNVSGRARKVVYLRGEDTEPGPWGASYEHVVVLETDHAVGVPKKTAEKLKSKELMPAPDQVLFVRLFPRDYEDYTVKLSVLHETEEVVEAEFPQPEGTTPNEDGYLDVRFLFVYGPDPLPEDVTFPGVTVVDVSEEIEDGHAPTVGGAALAKRRKDLPIESFVLKAMRLNCARLRFHTDSSIVLPSGLAVLTAGLKHARDNANSQLLVAAHTDTAGSEESNAALSEARAKSVLDLLRGDHEGWVADCNRDNSHRDEDVRAVLRWSAEYWNWACDPGAVTNAALSDEVLETVVTFKKRFNAKFTADYITEDDEEPAADDEFWERIFNLYGHALVDTLEFEHPDQLRDLCNALSFADPEHPSIGCGERNPLVDTGDGVSEEKNRRVEFLFFEQGRLPEPIEGDTSGTYLQAVYDDVEFTIEDLDCPEPQFYGDIPPNVVFVIDVSGSMRPRRAKGRAPARADRIGLAKRKLCHAIQDLRDDDRFAVIAYSTSVEMLWEQGDVPLLKLADDETKREAIAWVNERVAGGVTRTNEALELALKATGMGSGDRGVKFLSDGSPTSRESPDPKTEAYDDWKTQYTPEQREQLRRDEEANILSEVSANRGEWKVDAVGFFKEQGESGPLVEFMERMAGDNGGTFSHVPVPVKAKPVEAAAQKKGTIYACLVHPDGYKIANASLVWRKDGDVVTAEDLNGATLPDSIGDDGVVEASDLPWGSYTVAATPSDDHGEGPLRPVALPLTTTRPGEPRLQWTRFGAAE